MPDDVKMCQHLRRRPFRLVAVKYQRWMTQSSLRLIRCVKAQSRFSALRRYRPRGGVCGPRRIDVGLDDARELCGVLVERGGGRAVAEAEERRRSGYSLWCSTPRAICM